MSDKNSANKGARYLSWEQKTVVEQKGSFDLDLLGAYFNGFRSIYLLAYSKARSELYVAIYNVSESSFSKFKRLCKVDEVLYTAALYDETAQHSRWYILGDKNLWSLTLSKVSSEFTSDELTTVPDKHFPLKGNHYQKAFKGASLIVFDKSAWIIGGSRCKDRNGNDMDTRSRIILSDRWAEWLGGRKGGYHGGHTDFDYLVHPRTAPILHVHDKQLICLGGNVDSKSCVFETLAIRPFWWGKYGTCREDNWTYMYATERSILDNINCSIKTIDPRPASCIFNNHVFIFSDQLFSESKLYYKFHYVGGRGSGSGNGDWEFLAATVDAKSLRFTSAKATTVGRSMYLILFNAGDGGSGDYLGDNEERLGKTKVTVFEIKEAS